MAKRAGLHPTIDFRYITALGGAAGSLQEPKGRGSQERTRGLMLIFVDFYVHKSGTKKNGHTMSY